MFCKHCGQELSDTLGAQFCSSCGKQLNVTDSFLHWLPLILVGVAFLVFGLLGGDYDLEEINAFDYAAIFISVIAFASTFFLIPKTRKLFIVSIIICVLMMFGTISWVLL